MQLKHQEALTTWRDDEQVISTAPSGMESDTTTWEYDLATGLELRKTYADGKGTVKTYDAYNNLATVADAAWGSGYRGNSRSCCRGSFLCKPTRQ